jgi:hypothetical protein
MRNVFVLLLVVCFQSAFPQPIHLKSTILKFIGTEVNGYPALQADFVAQRNGQPMKLPLDAPTASLQLYEDGLPCPLTALQPSTHGLRMFLDVFVDVKDLSWEELLRGMRALETLSETQGLQFSPRFYARVGLKVQQLSGSNLNRLKLDSIPDPVFNFIDAVDYIQSQPSLFQEGNRVFLFFMPSVEPKDLTRLQQIIRPLLDHQLIFSAFLLQHVDISDPDIFGDRCLFVTDLTQPDVEIAKAVTSAADALRMSRFSVSFQSPNPRSLATDRTLTILANPQATGEPGQHQKAQEAVYVMKIPRATVDSAYVQLYLRTASALRAEALFIPSLDSLFNAYNLLPAEAFRRTATGTVREYGQLLLDSNKAMLSADLFDRAEKNWRIDPVAQPWYNDLKTRLLKAHSAILAETDNTLEIRTQIQASLAQLHPENRAMKKRYADLKGDLQRTRGEFWAAATSYRQGINVQSDSEMEKKLLDMVRKGVNSSFAAGHFDTLYRQGISFEKWLAPHFDLRYMFATACSKNKDFTRAGTNFEWLIQNWSAKQTLVSWQEIFSQLQQVYSSNLRFDDAFRVNERLYRQSEDARFLLQTVKNLRARYLVAVSAAFPVFWARNASSQARGKFFDKATLTSWPHYFQGATLITRDGAVIAALSHGKFLPPPIDATVLDSVASPQILDSSPGGKTVWMVSRTSGGFFVLQFSTDEDDEGNVLLSAVRAQRMLDEPWDQLAKREEVLGSRLASELITGMLSVEYELKETLNPASYWAVLSTIPTMKYLVFHAQGGAIASSHGFDRAKWAGDPDLWMKSSTVLAYMVQKVRYDTKDILDTANPVYVSGRCRGTIRLGITRPF